MKPIIRAAMSVALLFGGVVAPCVRGAAPPATRPNIIFILADDYGIDGVGCYGSDRFKDKTPNIDALAKTGARFDRCFAAPVCGPSRTMLITGRYAFRTGGLSNDSSPHVSSRDEPSVARVLKQAGYVTGMAGKWRQMGGLAGDWGFDDYRMSDVAESPSRVHGYFENGKHVKVEPGSYYPDVQQAFALDFLRRHKDETFFFYYASHLVHDPIVATPDSRPGETDGRTLYDDNVRYLDKQVGELVAQIDKLGLRERTLIVFSGDNGTDASGSRFSTIGGRRLSGGKRDFLEGGALVPLIVNWKGNLPAPTGGRVVRDLVSFTDLMPTFAEFAGAELPKGVTLDGRSFAPQLRGGQSGSPREWVFVQYYDKWYVRGDRWKMNELGELFDMKDAPFAETAVPADATDPESVAARKRLQAVIAELNPAGGKTEMTPKAKSAAKSSTTQALPKVVLLGDSIREGYAPIVAELLAGKATVSTPKANGGDTAKLLTNLDEWAIRERPDVVHFNCGIHDTKQSKETGKNQVSPEQYEANLREIVKRLREQTRAKVLFALSTPIMDERAKPAWETRNYRLINASITEYNRIALRVMEEMKVPVNDLPAALGDAEELARLLDAGGVHYTAEGRRRLAEAVASFVLPYVRGTGPSTAPAAPHP